MLQDSSEIESGTVVQTDVCVVGTGPAGMSIALELAKKKVSVLLLESGGFKESDAVQELNAGKNIGRKYFALKTCRSRYFGGSSNCWAGLCRPLEAGDFKARDWLPHSGWPIELSDLASYYDRAEPILRLRGPGYGTEGWRNKNRQPWSMGDLVESGVFKLSPPVRFGKSKRKTIEKSSQIRCVLNATLTNLELDDAMGRVVGLRVKRSEGGGFFKVRPKRVVIACGGIENARILLTNRAQIKNGIGNQHDVVGRYFMEHPHTDGEAVVQSGSASAKAEFYRPFRRNKQRVWGYLTVSEAVREREQILGFSCVLLRKKTSGGTLAEAIHHATHQFEGSEDDTRTVHLVGTPSEQAPNPNSRITLNGDKDALGVPRINLDWRLSDIDRKTIVRGHELLAAGFAKHGLGRFRLLHKDTERFTKITRGGWHHMGTTRMGIDPKKSVTDANCRVHGVSNLYMAGSSLFVTSGAANPTLTIVALALRLADHLTGEG